MHGLGEVGTKIKKLGHRAWLGQGWGIVEARLEQARLGLAWGRVRVWLGHRAWLGYGRGMVGAMILIIHKISHNNIM